MVGYTLQKITKTCTEQADAARMQPFSNMVSSYLIFNPTGIIFEVLSRKDDGYASRSHVNDLAETTGPVSKKDEVTAEV